MSVDGSKKGALAAGTSFLGTMAFPIFAIFAFVVCFLSRGTYADDKGIGAPYDRNQVPSWSTDDLQFFLHGSMGTEAVPENVLKAFRATYPDLMPGKDLTAFGLIGDASNDLPIGVSRRNVPYLGGLSSIGINCASCHAAEILHDGSKPIRVLGVTGHFDVEAFLGSIVVATFETSVPSNMARFLRNYLVVCDPQVSTAKREMLDTALARQIEEISAAISSEQADEAATPDKLLELDPALITLMGKHLEKDHDIKPVVLAMLRLFHNMRVALHVTQKLPEKMPPLSGPGRNNAFGAVSLALFNEPTIYAPAKYGVAWNLDRRMWVHWDGNTRSPLIRNLAASIGLGAPLVGKRALLDFGLVERHTRLSEEIRPPRYPWKIDKAAAERGRIIFESHCASCHVHTRTDEDKRLYSVDDVKTDPNRAKLFDDHQAQLFNTFFTEVEIAGYKPPREPALRSTGKYVAIDLSGVWARSPYLHNGSVRTMKELLTPDDKRAKKYHRGTRAYDEMNMGYADEGTYVFDALGNGNSNNGHEYGAADLTEAQKHDLIEYLKTL